MSARTVRLDYLRETLPDGAIVIAVTEFLATQMLIKPDGALYARWDPEKNEAVWYYSTDHTAIFEWPAEKEPILRQTSRGSFRSVVFRLGSLGSAEHDYVPLCGFYFLEHAKDGRLTIRRVMIHADFFPEFGPWIKATFLTATDLQERAAGPIFESLPQEHEDNT
jgi:hypothetical protein